jgi:hypothetical protein
MALPRARRMPPTLAVTAKVTLSIGTTKGEEETRSEAAAGGDQEEEDKEGTNDLDGDRDGHAE